jgi:hypothetical protein
MLAFARSNEIYLPPARCERASIFAFYPEEDQFGDVTEVEADSSTIRPAIFAHLMPDDVGLIFEAPRLHDGKTFWEQCVRAPEIEMRGWCRDVID